MRTGLTMACLLISACSASSQKGESAYWNQDKMTRVQCLDDMIPYCTKRGTQWR